MAEFEIKIERHSLTGQREFVMRRNGELVGRMQQGVDLSMREIVQAIAKNEVFQLEGWDVKEIREGLQREGILWRFQK